MSLKLRRLYDALLWSLGFYYKSYISLSILLIYLLMRSLFIPYIGPSVSEVRIFWGNVPEEVVAIATSYNHPYYIFLEWIILVIHIALIVVTTFGLEEEHGYKYFWILVGFRRITSFAILFTSVIILTLTPIVIARLVTAIMIEPRIINYPIPLFISLFKLLIHYLIF
ncbi:hypothetical protein DRJ17_05645, partial [Candidatus Woesearchaeota archaeon]